MADGNRYRLQALYRMGSELPRNFALHASATSVLTFGGDPVSELGRIVRRRSIFPLQPGL